MSAVTTDMIISANSAYNLMVAVNAYLATLVNPVVVAWDVEAAEVASRQGTEYKFYITTLSGGAALATPFLLDIIAQPTLPGLQTAVNAYRTANAGQFISGVTFRQIADENVTISQLMAAFLRNTTAGASANYTVNGGGGGGSGSLLAVNNLSDVASVTAARANLSAAQSGSNADITHLTALLDATMTAEAMPSASPSNTGIIYLANDNNFIRPNLMGPDGLFTALDQDVEWVCKNPSGSTIPVGAPVYASGVDGVSGKLTIALAQANALATSYVIGVTRDAIAPGAFGRVITIGRVSGANTAALTAGQRVYLSDSVAGGVSLTPPVNPGSFVVSLGTCRVANASTGLYEINVRTPVPALPTINPATLTFGASIAVDASLSKYFNLSVTSSAGTLANPTNLYPGMAFDFLVTQVGGPWTLAYGSLYKSPTGGGPALSGVAGAIDKISCYYNGTIILATIAQNFH